MKKFVLAVSVLSAIPGAAWAANCAGTAILQAQAALVSTKEGKAADEDLQNRLGPKYAELKKRGDDLKELQDKINRGGNTMSDSAKAALQKDYDSKNKALTRDQQDFQDDVNSETNKAKAGLIDKMKKVIDQFQKDHNYCLILDVSDPQTPVIAFADEIDITPQIIEAYDKAQAAAPSNPAAVKPSVAAPKPSAAKPPAAPPAKPPATAPAK